MTGLLLYILLPILISFDFDTSSAWLDISGYEGCTINLLEADVNNGSSVNLDEVFKLIQDDTEQMPSFTVYRLQESPFNPSKSTSYNYGEKCGINIVVGEGCEKVHFAQYFGSRYRRTSSIFISLTYLAPGCESKCGRAQNLSSATYVVGNVHCLVLKKETNEIIGAHTLCPTCFANGLSLGSWVHFDFRLPPKSIVDLSVHAKEINKHYHEAPIAIYAGFGNDRKCNIFSSECIVEKCLECSPGLTVTGHLAEKMNFTTRILPYYTRKGISAGIIVLEEVMLMDYRVLSLLRKSSRARLLYCVKSESREESYHISYWTVPFDLSTWIMIILMCGLLTAIYKGNWLLVTALLMRQYQRLVGRGRLQVFCLLVTIVIGASYESSLAGYQTVPPPIARIETFKELMERNYKILLGVAQSNDLIDYRLTFTSLFKQSKIPERQNSSIFKYNTFTASMSLLDLLSFCNTTATAASNMVFKDNFVLASIMRSRYGVSCHLVKNKDDSIQRQDYYYFMKYSGPRLFALTQRLSESGVLNWIYSFTEKIQNHAYMAQIGGLIREENQPTAYQISDWKIKSIWCAWFGLLILASLVFGFEVVRFRN
jgi:hypothetical protein